MNPVEGVRVVQDLHRDSGSGDGGGGGGLMGLHRASTRKGPELSNDSKCSNTTCEDPHKIGALTFGASQTSEVADG